MASETNIKRFRNKPAEIVEVDAIQLDAHNGDEIVRWLVENGVSAYHSMSQSFHFLSFVDEVINAQINLGEGDWVVRSEDGRFTRRSPGEFEKLYEA